MYFYCQCKLKSKNLSLNERKLIEKIILLLGLMESPMKRAISSSSKLVNLTHGQEKVRELIYRGFNLFFLSVMMLL